MIMGQISLVIFNLVDTFFVGRLGTDQLAAMSFTVEELAQSIKKHIPEFEIEYKPDHRQAIADTWPKSIDDSAAREEWGWQHKYDLDKMTKDMLVNLQAKYDKNLI